jgi:hypothetical protein
MNKAHFFLACCEITFVDTEGNTGITRVNSMIKSIDQTVPARLLGRAQQAAQMQLIKSLNDSNLNILNVIFITINYIGEMTDEEFHKQDVDASSEVLGNA